MPSRSPKENCQKRFVHLIIFAIFTMTKIAMIFNLQTANHKKISSQNIYYANTSEIIDYCVANFGPTRILRDDQLENDVTFTVVR